MRKHRFGWPDLLLPLAFVPALAGYFYVAMAMLALYAVLYRRAIRRGAGSCTSIVGVANADPEQRSPVTSNS